MKPPGTKLAHLTLDRKVCKAELNQIFCAAGTYYLKKKTAQKITQKKLCHLIHDLETNSKANFFPRKRLG